jgi:hypothetical protein
VEKTTDKFYHILLYLVHKNMNFKLKKKDIKKILAKIHFKKMMQRNDTYLTKKSLGSLLSYHHFSLMIPG